MTDRDLRQPAGEQGFALVLALGMIALLSLLGVLVLGLTNSEVAISGNYRTSQMAFRAAERAVTYAMGNTAITGSTVSSTDLNGGTHPASIEMNGAGLDSNATNVCNNLGVGELPDWLAQSYSREKFGGNFYIISVTGEGPNGRGKARIETQHVRIFQKGDEGQLISTSGG